MEFLEKVYENIDNYKEEMLEELNTLLSYPSVAEGADQKPPFGQAVNDIFHYVLSKAEREGFATANIDEMGGHIEWSGRSHRLMGMAGHLDVVPAGTGWVHEPYALTIEDGKLIGRGVMDNKGPTLMVYYAMRALRDAGFEPEYTIRLILGLDEEQTWAGMKRYFEVEDNVDTGFIPDADFPVIHGEKGILSFQLARKFGKAPDKGLRLRSMTGGSAVNMVSDAARVILLSDDKADYETVKAHAAQVAEEQKCEIKARLMGKSLELLIDGRPSHGSTPWEGLNAISVAMDVLGRVNFASEETNDFVSFYNECIGYEFYGESIGCGFSDEPSGKLIFNVGTADISAESAALGICVRYPVTMSGAEVYDGVKGACEEAQGGVASVVGRYNVGIVKGDEKAPIYFPKDSEHIRKLMEIYGRHLGDTTSEPIVIGGGSYARIVENTVCFGPLPVGHESTAHQREEYILEDVFMKVTKLYAETIYALAGEGA